MKTVNMNEILNVQVGDTLMSSQTGFIFSASTSVDEIKRAVETALHEISIYNENEDMLDDDDVTYTNDKIYNVAFMLQSLALATNSDVFTVWFDYK
jgi:hypothetical protein